MKNEELTYDKLPVEIQERMLLEQEKQGNERNPDAFRKNLHASARYNGFDWQQTDNGSNFWSPILRERNFDVFFEEYPKKEEELLELEKEEIITEQLQEEKPSLNLIELLANAPTGLSLYSSAIGPCTLVRVENDRITVEAAKESYFQFSSEGKLILVTAALLEVSECTLFPSKDQRDWSKFVVDPLKFKWSDYKPVCYSNCEGEKQVFPAHEMVQSWLFTEHTEDEAALAHHMAIVAEKSGMSANDLQHIFPAVLRMLKNDSVWAK